MRNRFGKKKYRNVEYDHWNFENPPADHNRCTFLILLTHENNFMRKLYQFTCDEKEDSYTVLVRNYRDITDIQDSYDSYDHRILPAVHLNVQL